MTFIQSSLYTPYTIFADTTPPKPPANSKRFGADLFTRQTSPNSHSKSFSSIRFGYSLEEEWDKAEAKANEILHEIPSALELKQKGLPDIDNRDEIIVNLKAAQHPQDPTGLVYKAKSLKNFAAGHDLGKSETRKTLVWLTANKSSITYHDLDFAVGLGDPFHLLTQVVKAMDPQEALNPFSTPGLLKTNAELLDIAREKPDQLADRILMLTTLKACLKFDNKTLKFILGSLDDTLHNNKTAFEAIQNLIEASNNKPDVFRDYFNLAMEKPELFDQTVNDLYWLKEEIGLKNMKLPDVRAVLQHLQELSSANKSEKPELETKQAAKENNDHEKHYLGLWRHTILRESNNHLPTFEKLWELITKQKSTDISTCAEIIERLKNGNIPIASFSTSEINEILENLAVIKHPYLLVGVLARLAGDDKKKLIHLTAFAREFLKQHPDVKSDKRIDFSCLEKINQYISINEFEDKELWKFMEIFGGFEIKFQYDWEGADAAGMLAKAAHGDRRTFLELVKKVEKSDSNAIKRFGKVIDAFTKQADSGEALPEEGLKTIQNSDIEDYSFDTVIGKLWEASGHNRDLFARLAQLLAKDPDNAFQHAYRLNEFMPEIQRRKLDEESVLKILKNPDVFKQELEINRALMAITNGSPQYVQRLKKILPKDHEAALNALDVLKTIDKESSNSNQGIKLYLFDDTTLQKILRVYGTSKEYKEIAHSLLWHNHVDDLAFERITSVIEAFQKEKSPEEALLAAQALKEIVYSVDMAQFSEQELREIAEIFGRSEKTLKAANDLSLTSKDVGISFKKLIRLAKGMEPDALHMFAHVLRCASFEGGFASWNPQALKEIASVCNQPKALVSSILSHQDDLGIGSLNGLCSYLASAEHVKKGRPADTLPLLLITGGLFSRKLQEKLENNPDFLEAYYYNPYYYARELSAFLNKAAAQKYYLEENIENLWKPNSLRLASQASQIGYFPPVLSSINLSQNEQVHKTETGYRYLNRETGLCVETAPVYTVISSLKDGTLVIRNNLNDPSGQTLAEPLYYNYRKSYGRETQPFQLSDLAQFESMLAFTAEEAANQKIKNLLDACQAIFSQRDN